MRYKTGWLIIFSWILATAFVGAVSDVAVAEPCGPEGTFILTVPPPVPGLPPVKELLTLHEGGTISETNTQVHANSATPFFNFNGSDGYGSWARDTQHNVVFKIVKMLFDGDTNVHIGYLVVEGTASIDGEAFTVLQSEANLLVGPDLFAPFEVVPLGPAQASGWRVAVAACDDDDDDDSDDDSDGMHDLKRAF